MSLPTAKVDVSVVLQCRQFTVPLRLDHGVILTAQERVEGPRDEWRGTVEGLPYANFSIRRRPCKLLSSGPFAMQIDTEVLQLEDI